MTISVVVVLELASLSWTHLVAPLNIVENSLPSRFNPLSITAPCMANELGNPILMAAYAGITALVVMVKVYLEAALTVLTVLARVAEDAVITKLDAPTGFPKL